MSAVTRTPPWWAEALLERLLTGRDRETVVGDLREEYAESVAPRCGRLRADLWYLRQVLSFLPGFIARREPVNKTLLSMSFFTLACTCWLTMMDILLHHPGYLPRIGISVCIALICVATIFVRLRKRGVRSERWMWAAAVVQIGVGGQAFYRNARSDHFEGFVLVISVALLFQGALMLLSARGRSGGVRTLRG